MSRELALHYLNKHHVPDDKFGVGPFLHSGNFELLADPDFERNQMLILKVTSGMINECNRMSQKVYQDIRENDPQLKPVLITDCINNSIHNWVRISSPDGIFDIDCTPWFRSIEQKSSGTEKIFVPAQDYVEIMPNSGVPFFIRTNGDDTIYSHLMGAPSYFFYGDAFSDYTFRVEIRLDTSFAKRTKKFINLFLSLVDIPSLAESAEIHEAPQVLLATNKVILGAMFSSDPQAICETASIHELESIIRKKEGKEFADEIARNTEALFLLLKKLRSPIPIHKSRAGAIEFQDHLPKRIIKW